MKPQDRFRFEVHRIANCELNQQHEELYSIILDAIRASDVSRKEYREVERTIDLLQVKTEEHFRFEEHLMWIHEYPHLAAHAKIHEGLLRCLASLKASLEEAKFTFTEALVETFMTWLFAHIDKNDKDLAEFLREHHEENDR